MSTITAAIACDIVYDNDNQQVLIKFFKDSVSGKYHNENNYQIYLDLNNYRIFEICQAGQSTALSREDGSLAQLHAECRAEKLPEDERYNEECGKDLNEYGLENWLDYIKERVRMVLEAVHAEKSRIR